MLKRNLFLLMLALVFALAAGCSEMTDKASGPQHEMLTETEDVVTPPESDVGGKGNDALVPLAASYPNYSFVLNVPWICQMPPKNSSHTDAQAWARSNNCGQAVGVMLGGYFNHGAVATWVIDAENRWLGYPLPYGSGTSSSKLRSLLWGFHRVHSAEYHGSHADDVINEVVNNRRPTIVCVTIKGGMLVPRGTSGSRSHWALAVGWNGQGCSLQTKSSII